MIILYITGQGDTKESF